MRKIAIANQKGGVAKTTTTINLGHALAEMGSRVLLVDLDPQGHLAEGFGILSNDLETEMSAVLDGAAQISDVIRNVRPNLDLAPSNIRLSAVEVKLFLKPRREDKLKQALAGVEGRYDIALIDCPPSLGILTVNALSAADEVLIPMTTDFYSMLGVDLLLRSIEEMRAELNPGLRVLGVLPTRATRTVNAREVLDHTRSELNGRVKVFDTMIRETVRFREAASLGMTALEHPPAMEAVAAYRELAKELVA
ncbi:MAG: ParA family protein [SAR202 cluster bacterium]|nr:ParA family protein [SAR202 cluster bacterium]